MGINNWLSWGYMIAGIGFFWVTGEFEDLNIKLMIIGLGLGCMIMSGIHEILSKLKVYTSGGA